MAKSGPRDGEFGDGKLWFHRKGSMVTIGLTSLATEELGQVESVEFPDEEADFVKGDVVVTIDGTNGKFEVTTPASGIVKEINEQAQKEPDMITEDPLEEGWLIKLEIEDVSDLHEYASDDDDE